MSKKPSFVLTFLLILGLAYGWFTTPVDSDYHFLKLGTVPVLEKGRIKPLETVARTRILEIQGKQKITEKGTVISPMEWMMRLMTHDASVDDIAIFPLQHPELKTLLKQEDKKKVSFNEIKPSLSLLLKFATDIEKTPAKQRDAYQRSVWKLYAQIMLYSDTKIDLSLPSEIPLSSRINSFVALAPKSHSFLSPHFKNGKISAKDAFEYETLLRSFKEFKAQFDASALHLIPDSSPHKWRKMGGDVLKALALQDLSPFTPIYAKLDQSLRNANQAQFNATVDDLIYTYKTQFPETYDQVQLEVRFNRYNPFYKATVLYVIIAIIILLAWLFNSGYLIAMGTNLMTIAFGLHTLGIVVRMFIQGRPPVTNLYTSAVFVGWVAILVGLVLERFTKRGVGPFVGTIVGFVTLIIAHHLSLSGDTLEMMQAVLDTNIWLATHVVVITMGYGATILAGMLAHLYIVMGIFTKKLDKPFAKQITQMVFATNCVALLTMFIGTVLGGIWADQSWGRFWGWDPKENGALLIVLWLAIILHARIGGYIKARGMMVLTLFSTIVTAFSWFGVNMLGIGLHSYGFMEETFFWLMVFIFVALFFIWLASLPLKNWRSFK